VFALADTDLQVAGPEMRNGAANAFVKGQLNLFYPMNEFYERSGVPLPDVFQVEGHDVPEPYRSLLVHDRDMTPTLAAAHGRNMQLRVFERILREDVLARQIILEVEDTGTPVIFAAIKIYLDRFPVGARRLILEGQQPFGTILHGQKIVHFSRPEAFIRVVPDETINRALGQTAPSVLYGRRSALWNSANIPLAQVLEILPPMAPGRREKP
jgi:chorismate-pyruvate lyase